jgi:retron-type reverse transcriptase
MEITKQHTDLISTSLKEVNSKEDIVNLLNLSGQFLFGDKHKPYSLKSISYFADHRLSNNRYTTFEIPKKSGGKRIIHSPEVGLKSILKSLNFILQLTHSPNQNAKGFIPGVSITDNAKYHVGQNYVYNIDLKDFFHSFEKKRVKGAFMLPPFKLTDTKEPLAYLLANLCTHPLKSGKKVKQVLPQGSPASPMLTNILCQTLDRRLNGLAKRFGLKYTRYADDITFSSMHNVYTKKEFQKELKRIIKDQGFSINPKKTRLQKHGYRQDVTGLLVNDKVNVSKRYIKDLRKWIYLWERYGYKKAEINFRKDYILDKGHVKGDKPNLINVLDGKLEFLKMVKGADDGTYQGLKRRFDKLAGLLNPINKVLDVWETKGIDKAMDVFYGVKS